MQHALTEARTALEDGEFPVGCVLVQDNEIIRSGRRRNSEGAGSNEIDHAEMVTLRALLAEQPRLDCRDLTVYSTMEPCLMCYTTLLLSGVRRFVWAYEDVMGGGTNLPLQQLAPLYQDMHAELVPDVLRRESLSLFGQFFEQASYWQDSLLADYTLAQYNNERNEPIPAPELQYRAETESACAAA
ncbi:tRNA(adenine34) deaminase [Candidatus Electrothrix marina]|nr:tRNA(adenine34) deaminase [Candidatus Electrothrix marina]RWX52364.1 tRNA(adenine34) deaminase [Candidatus Electrothrix marina]